MLFLGVDGGQSSTKALIADESGRILGAGRAGPCNHVNSQAEGRQKLASAVRECVDATLASCGLNVETAAFESACFGMSGGPDDKSDVLHKVLRTRRLLVTHDAAIALTGATAGEPGIVVISGTGSIAFGRNAEGLEARAGGWGYVFGDEGGAFDIVRQATRAMLRAEEGWGTATALTKALLSASEMQDANSMLHAFYTSAWPRSRVATLAAHVDATAEGGDAIARDILKAAAVQLAQLAAVIANRWVAPDHRIRVAGIGGTFQSAIVQRHFEENCNATGILQPIRAAFQPVAGALIEALRAAGRVVALSSIPDF